MSVRSWTLGVGRIFGSFVDSVLGIGLKLEFCECCHVMTRCGDTLLRSAGKLNGRNVCKECVEGESWLRECGFSLDHARSLQAKAAK